MIETILLVLGYLLVGYGFAIVLAIYEKNDVTGDMYETVLLLFVILWPLMMAYILWLLLVDFSKKHVRSIRQHLNKPVRDINDDKS